jgi:hypothetical protein
MSHDIAGSVSIHIRRVPPDLVGASPAPLRRYEGVIILGMAGRVY